MSLGLLGAVLAPVAAAGASSSSADQSISVVIPEVTVLRAEIQSAAATDPAETTAVVVLSVSGNTPAREVAVTVQSAALLTSSDPRAETKGNRLHWKIASIAPSTSVRLAVATPESPSSILRVDTHAANAEPVVLAASAPATSTVTMRPSGSARAVVPAWFVAMIATAIVMITTLGATGFGWSRSRSRSI